MGKIRYKPQYKRVYDVVVTLGLAPVWLPVCALAMLSVWVLSGRPVIYTQDRLGLGGRVFRVLKIRTMTVDAERDTGPVWPTRNDPRVTPVGRILRATSVDEWLQAINILRGDMSVVGPRPERPEFAERFRRTIPRFHERLTVRPGLIALSYIRKGSYLPIRHRLRYDLFYIQRMGLRMDTWLLSVSAWAVVKRLF